MAATASSLSRQSTPLLPSTLAIARRAILRFVRSPQLLVLGTIQMAGFMLVYRYVFGGAINPDGVRYVDFLVPGFVTTGVLFLGIGTAVAMAEDLQEGFIDRLRSLPIPRGAVLAGRAFADTAILIWSLGVTVALGFLVGFRFHGSLLDGLAAFGLLILFGYVFEWLFIAVGLFAGNAQAAQGLGLLVFPLTFVSSAYVPVDTMPAGLRAVAEHQPITYMVDAVRALTLGPDAESALGHPTSYFVTRALAWALAIFVVCLPLAVAKYRRG
jgi:ABC-2 type transport system permease protein